MANITYNNTNYSNLVTFTDIPNILKVTWSNSGTRQSVSLVFNGNLYSQPMPSEGYWNIQILGETITSVNDYANAINKNFFVSPLNNSTAASVARALRNCPTVVANYTVSHDNNKVELLARVNGQFDTPIETNIPSTFLSKSIAIGSLASGSLNGCKIDVAVFGNGRYITTLEKNGYNGEAAFDMSPVLTTLAERGKTVPYSLLVSTIDSSGVYSELGRVSTNYITQGYMVNQGEKYLPIGSNATIAQNLSRGVGRSGADISNKTTLYVYGNSIPLSFYTTSPTGSKTFYVYYKNSALETITSDSYSYVMDGSSLLQNIEIPLSSTALTNSFYVDIEIPNTYETIRYTVIKPIKATEYYQRILWRNSYGGVSFFDFTGQKTENRDLSIETYQKNIFDYYTDARNELEMVYNNEVKYTVTLKSHLFENDGKYVFNDLLQSPEVWTEVNGEEYAIIIDNINVDETDRNNIYEASVKFHYSQEPSLI